jgi:hypothetical protein
MISCRKTAPLAVSPIGVTDIFSVTNNTVTNGQTIQFNLTTPGKYTLKLYDTTTNQVVTKEKFSGVSGNNIKKIYTTTFTQKVLYLYLTDSVGNQIKKTKITIN